MEKVYIVKFEWVDKYGERFNTILGTFATQYDAIQCMLKERDEILQTTYGGRSLEQLEQDGFEVDEDNGHIWIESPYGSWDEIIVTENTIQGSEYIDVMFEYRGELYTKRVYVADIDMTYLDDQWKVWIEQRQQPDDDDVFFALIGKKDGDKPSVNGLFIEVYNEAYAEEPDKTINSFYIHRSTDKYNKYTKIGE